MEFPHTLMRTEEEQMFGEATSSEVYESRVEAPQFGYDLPSQADLIYRLGEDTSSIEAYPFSSDYYHRELEPVRRGLTLPPNFATDDLFGTPDEISKAKGELKSAARVQVYNLDDDGLPFGGLAVTSVYLGSATTVPGALAWMEKLFSQELTGEVLKNKPEKGTMKARVCHQGGHWRAHCTVKVRLHRDCPAAAVSEHFCPEERGLVAEFRKRDGDSLAFNAVFQRAKDYLELASMAGDAPATQTAASKDDGAAEGSGRPSSFVPMIAMDLEEADVVSAEDLQPALDLLQKTNELLQPGLQVEAVNTMAILMSTAAVETATTVVVCHALHSMQGVFSSMLSSPDMAVAFPAAQLALSLPPEYCSDNFTSGLLQNALLKLGEACRQEAVRAVLATLVMNVVLASASNAAAETPEILPELQAALGRPCCQTLAVAKPLKRAVEMLQAHGQ